MPGFRDYQSVIQAGARCGDGKLCAQLDAGQVGGLFGELVEASWSPSEIEILRRAADSALL